MCSVKRQSEEVRAVKNGLMLVTCLPPATRVTSVSRLLPKAISGSVAVGICVSIHDPCCYQRHRDAQNVDHYPCSLWVLWAVLPPAS